MPNVIVAELDAVEILDSRGRPTLSVTVRLADGTAATAGVPSGASTGRREAVERRDGDTQRYGGAGVTAAAASVVDSLADAVIGQPFSNLAGLDAALIAADGTPNKARLGANAIVGVSMAAARAIAAAAGRPLWETLSVLSVPARMPVPHFNVVNGGAHAGNPLDFQEFMLAPVGAPTYAEALRAGAEIYQQLKALLADQGLATGLGDEGGFAPDLARPEEVLGLLVRAITDAGYTADRRGVAIALDPAASGFYSASRYRVMGQNWSSTDMIEYYATLIEEFPVWSIEDGLAEDDWDGWRKLTERLGDRIQLVGDDIFVTDPQTITKAARKQVANAALIKVNQIGSVTETLEALKASYDAGYAAMVSHRSGETSDTFIADLAVGCGCGQLKSGAPARGERVAKYNRLLEISASNPGIPYGVASG